MCEEKERERSDTTGVLRCVFGDVRRGVRRRGTGVSVRCFFFLNDGSTSQAARGRAAAAASGVPEQPGVGVVMGTHLM